MTTPSFSPAGKNSKKTLCKPFGTEIADNPKFTL